MAYDGVLSSGSDLDFVAVCYHLLSNKLLLLDLEEYLFVEYDQRDFSEPIGFVTTVSFLADSIKRSVCYFLGVSNVDYLLIVFGDMCLGGGGGGNGVVAQSVERETRCEEVLGSIPFVAARSLLVGSVSV